MSVIATWEQKRLWLGESPVRAQDAEKLGRQHHIAVLRALAVTHQNDARTSSTRSPATYEARSPAA